MDLFSIRDLEIQFSRGIHIGKLIKGNIKRALKEFWQAGCKISTFGNYTDALCGEGVTKQKASGRLCVCKDMSELKEQYLPGDIVVINDTNNKMLEFLKTASGIVVENSTLDSHAVTVSDPVGLSLDIPVVINVKSATDLLKTGVFATVDSENGFIVADHR